ncbi:MAG: erythromycin esterase family protein [Candidatus Aminicenantes bacterium]|nr:erythromycin esterase family protein [Candidatus Aminicenantes bacterium]
MKFNAALVFVLSFLSMLFFSGCTSKSAVDAPDYTSFDQWAKAKAVPLKTTEPGSGFEDLALLKDVVGDAKVVALGESIHYGHEFIRLHHRLIEYLVDEMGFTAVAQETGFSESELVHKYVVGRVDEPPQWTEDPDKLDTVGYTWGFGKEKAQLALIRWMRDFNANPARTRKINFYGIDVGHGYSNPLTSLESAWKYLERVDPAYKSSDNRRNLRSLVEKFLGSGGGIRFVSTQKYHELPIEAQNAYKAEIARLIAHFEINRVEFIRASSIDEYEWAYRHAVAARQLNQCTEYLLDFIKDQDFARSSRYRDYCQADNICWTLDREKPRGRVIVMAHNAHIQKDLDSNPEWFSRPYPPAGMVLQSRIGDDYVNIGFIYNRSVGGFKPYEAEGKYDLSQTGAGSIGSALSKVGLPLFILNLKDVPNEGPVYEWLNQEKPMMAEADYMPINILKAWDALLYIEELSYAQR